jgi:C4-dicarboxylate-specific signal transduction histidine kinase
MDDDLSGRCHAEAARCHQENQLRESQTMEALMVHEAQVVLRTALPSAAEVALDEGQGLPAIWANATPIAQVLLNLITNAVRALQGPVGGRVCLSLGRLAARVRLQRG